MQSQLQKAVTPEAKKNKKTDDAERMKVLRKTVKKAIEAKKQLSSVGQSLGQVADGLKVSSDG